MDEGISGHLRYLQSTTSTHMGLSIWHYFERAKPCFSGTYGEPGNPQPLSAYPKDDRNEAAEYLKLSHSRLWLSIAQDVVIGRVEIILFIFADSIRTAKDRCAWID